MDLRRLRYFVAVAEELSFTRAAERLHMAQPPLSTQIRLLEEDLGAELFVRERKRIFLAPAGRELLGRARAILLAAQDAAAAARNASGGRLARATLAYTASAMFTERLPAALRRFRTERADCDLVLVEMPSLDQLHALEDRTVDIGVLRRPDLAVPKGVVVRPWYTSPLVAALPKDHPLAARDGIHVADLRDEALITYPRDAGIGLHRPVMRLCAKFGFKPRVVREAREPALMVGLVAAGSGIAIVPYDTCSIRLDGVVYRRVLDPDATSTLFLCHREAELAPATACLLARLTEGPVENPTRDDGPALRPSAGPGTKIATPEAPTLARPRPPGTGRA